MRLIIYSYMNKQIHSVGNMRPQTNHVFSILVQATLLSIYFPLFLCHNNNQENVNVIAGGVVIRRLAASSVATCVHNPGSKSTVCTATAVATAPAATTTTPVVTAPIAPAATTTTPVITAPAPPASPAQPRPEPQGPSIPQPSTPLPSYKQQQSTVVKSYKRTGVYINPGLALGVAGVVISAIIITVVCCMIRRCSLEGPNKVSNQDIEKFLLQHGSLALKRYKYSEIKKITKSFRDKLGQGGYGSVYKGVLPDGCLVAVKVLMESDSNGEEFINEVASISRTSHVNIVNLLGFCYDRKKRALVYQYMPNKSLDKFISNADCPLDLQNLYNIAVGVAKGLEYLHTGCNTRIVHFDIKPQNILLDEEFCPKISDFGLAKLCKKKQSILSVLGTRGTVGYIAPEVFSRNFGGVSHKSDVYSYGMMVLEMAGARNTVEVEAIQSSTENYFPDKIYEQVILDVTKKLDGFTFEKDEEIAKKMFLVGFWCIQTIPSDRPSISKVVEMLEGSLGSIQIPPKPVLCIPTLPIQNVSSSFSSYAEAENSAEYVDHPEVLLSINCTK